MQWQQIWVRVVVGVPKAAQGGVLGRGCQSCPLELGLAPESPCSWRRLMGVEKHKQGINTAKMKARHKTQNIQEMETTKTTGTHYARSLWFHRAQSHQVFPGSKGESEKELVTLAKLPSSKMGVCCLAYCHEWENVGSCQNPSHPQMGIPKKQNRTRCHRRSFYDWQEEASMKGCFLFSVFEADICSGNPLNWSCASGPWHVSKMGSPQEAALQSWGAEGKDPASEFWIWVRVLISLGPPNINLKNTRWKITNPNHQGQINLSKQLVKITLLFVHMDCLPPMHGSGDHH